MSIKTHYVNPGREAQRVALALKERGYNVEPAECTGYVSNIINRFNEHEAPEVLSIIELGLTGRTSRDDR